MATSLLHTQGDGTHGETPRSRDGRLAGWVNTPLTAKGIEQALAIKPLLDGGRFAGVWSSDLGRAVRTARLAWGEPRRDPRLREISFGVLEGASWARLAPHHKEALLRFEGFHPTGGESLAQVRERVFDFLAGLTPGRHLLFTHGGVIRMLTREVGHDGFMPTGAVVGVGWTRKRLLFVHAVTAA
jgi:probable phosphoglycerate mutase